MEVEVEGGKGVCEVCNLYISKIYIQYSSIREELKTIQQKLTLPLKPQTYVNDYVPLSFLDQLTWNKEYGTQPQDK